MLDRLQRSWPSFVIATVASPALAQTSTERPNLWHYGWDWGWGHTFFGSLMMIVFWGGIILLVVVAARWLVGGATNRTASATEKSAFDIVHERFARGDIDRWDFEERKGFLSSRLGCKDSAKVPADSRNQVHHEKDRGAIIR